MDDIEQIIKRDLHISNVITIGKIADGIYDVKYMSHQYFKDVKPCERWIRVEVINGNAMPYRDGKFLYYDVHLNPDEFKEWNRNYKPYVPKWSIIDEIRLRFKLALFTLRVG